MKLSAEHIRFHAEMYIGRLSDGKNYHDGIYTLLQMVLEQTYTMPHRKMTLNASSNTVTIRVYDHEVKAEDPLTWLEDEERYTMTIVNALCIHFAMSCCHKNTCKSVAFSKGICTNEQVTPENSNDYIQFSITPDREIFDNCSFREDIVRTIIRYRAYTDGWDVTYNQQKMTLADGMAGLLKDKLTEEYPSCYPIYQIRKEWVDFVFTHTRLPEYQSFSFANGILTFNGGTHERAVRSGLMAAMKELNPHITDNQIMLKGLMLVLSIHIEDLWFESATYCKLASSYRDKAHQQPIHDELSRMAKDGVKELYMTNPDFRTFIEQLHDNSYSHS